MTWRQLLRWTNTDRELLQRHCRYLLLVAPLLASTALAWKWMYGYWDDLWNHGDGPPLMTDALPTAREVGGPPMLRSALTASWLPEGVREVVQGVLQSVQGLLGEEAAGAEPPRVHPAGISRNWSMLYVWLQYVQWYKVLCWLLIMVIGGSDGLLPPVARAPNPHPHPHPNPHPHPDPDPNQENRLQLSEAWRPTRGVERPPGMLVLESASFDDRPGTTMPNSFP